MMAGQLIKRGDNNYTIRVYTGRDGTGKRRYINKTFKGNKHAAQTELNKMLHSRDIGTLAAPSKGDFGDYLDEWLKNAAKPRVRPRTHDGYKYLVDKYIKPELGALRLHKITPLDIQKLYTALLARKLSPKTVRHVHGVVRSALNQALKWRLLGINPALAVELPKQKKKEMKAFSVEEAGRFLKHAAKNRWGTLFSVALTSGMRPGEYLGLKWPDIDFENGKVVVRRTVVSYPKTGKWEFAEPKTSQSARPIPLPTSVMKALAEHKKKQAAERLKAGKRYKQHDLVFTSRTGEPLNQANLVKRHFRKILEAAELSMDYRLYDLRHSCATLLLDQGEHPKIVSERLGHASITLTLDTYTHVLPTMQQQAADRLEGVLFAKGDDSPKLTADQT